MQLTDSTLTAKIEPFDSFWEGPEDIEKGYSTLCQFYRVNYLPWFPPDKSASVLIISCGPGYFVHMLNQAGYSNVKGIDSYEAKISHAREKGLDCETARCIEFLNARPETFDVIVCEQELNHLTKAEITGFLELVRQCLKPGGVLLSHALNGANPITGPEALAQNFDHYNTFTEYTFEQILAHAGFEKVRVFPLNLYVFFKNPFNYVAWAASGFLSLCFRCLFVLYGKSNKLFTKKIAASCHKPI